MRQWASKTPRPLQMAIYPLTSQVWIIPTLPTILESAKTELWQLTTLSPMGLTVSWALLLTSSAWHSLRVFQIWVIRNTSAISILQEIRASCSPSKGALSRKTLSKCHWWMENLSTSSPIRMRFSSHTSMDSTLMGEILSLQSTQVVLITPMTPKMG